MGVYMRGLKILVATLVAATPFVAHAEAADNRLELQCKVLDASGQPRTEFAPDDEIQPFVHVNVPWHRTGSKLKLEGYLNAKIKGLRFGTRLGDNVVEIPNRTARQQVPGWSPKFEERIQDGFAIDNYNLGLGHAYKIPTEFPEGAATLKVLATLAEGTPGEVTKRCEQTIHIVR